MSAMIESRSPHDPADVLVSVPVTASRAVAAAFDRGRTAACVWARVHATERATALNGAADALEAAADEMSRLVVREVGKPITEARQEIARGINILRYQAQTALDPDGETFPVAAPAHPDTLLMARRRPRGVAGLVTPWNFPVAIPLWKAAPALTYGNAVVLKPSPAATAVALRLAELLAPALPPDVLQVVPGDGETGKAVVERADVVSFTGSTTVGGAVALAAARSGVPVQCEMGGLNASIVLPDVDVEAVAGVVAASAMGYAGQKCTATSRVIVVGDGRPFTEALVAAVEALRVGDPADEQTSVGPVITADARERVLAAARDASAGGARVLTGGTAAGGPGHGVVPTLLGDLPDGDRLLSEEVFGPIAAVVSARDAGEAARIADGVPYGLVTSIFTRDLDQALGLSAQMRTGMIRINQPTSGVDFHAPFGGAGISSYGPREQGKQARELYTATHTVTVAPSVG